MPVRFQHDQNSNSFYFATFTCYKWLHLFEIANAFDTVYKWFDHLYENNIYVTGYVIMPNHVHVLLYFPQMPKSLNTIIGNAKRFIAYEIIKRLEESKEHKLLDLLHSGVKKSRAKKGQLHKVFEDSFDAKQCHSEEFIFQKLDYIHHNPVSKKWNLVDDFTEYEHCSASFYERAVKKYENTVHVKGALFSKLPGSLPSAQGLGEKTPGGQ
jgi:REP element-mobilizing transposase RayT